MNIKLIRCINVFMTSLLVIICANSFLYAQKNGQSSKVTDYVKEQHIIKQQDAINAQSQLFKINFNTNAAEGNFLTPEFSLGGIEFPNPERNFSPPIAPQAAGDVNGDGNNDLFYNVNAADLTTEDLEDRAPKMEIFRSTGSGLDGSDAELIRNDFTYIADFDNNGTTDAIKVEENNVSIVIDESDGELTNFTEKEILNLDFFPQMVSNGDLNGDGFDDAILFNTTPDRPGDVTFSAVLGAASIDSISVQSLTYTAEGNFGVDRNFI